ncbi:MAG: hypothetical protein NTV54_00790 [Ignavibacteriales bacterium]|nr:hypothetical protein [Ignavibacteriales bacterium]
MEKKLSIDLLAPGMVLAETVKDVHGRVLFPEGSVIAERGIQALRTWGIIEVLVSDNPTDSALQEGSTLAALDQAAVEAAELFKFNVNSTPLVDELRRLSILHLAKTKMRSLRNGQ